MPTTPTPADTTRHPGGCLQPVLLRGRVDHIDGATGELLHRYTTVHEPGGVLPIACKTRRASRCPPCAEVYRADTYQLIRAGLTGGKGIPDTVATHPRVFTTLTAPSFGPVHVHREKDGRLLRCRPRRRGGTCPHSNRMSCPGRHTRDDTRLGEPLCPDCYDYTGAVLFNACAPELWRRFTITLRRALARQAGLTNKALMTVLINAHNEPPGGERPDDLLPHARLHDLRHVHATTLLLAGVPVHVVAARLGHADPSITLRVYAHVISDQLAEAADIFARAIAATG